MVECVY